MRTTQTIRRRFATSLRQTPVHPAIVALIVVAVGSGCTRAVDVEKVPIGTEVEIVRADGGVVRGTLTARDDENLRMSVGPAARSIKRDEVTSVQVVEGSTPPPLPEVAKFREFTLPEGTSLSASLNSSIGSTTSRVEDPVEATLTRAVLVDGVEVLPAGSVVSGVVTTAIPSGKVRGRASLSVRFGSLSVADGGPRYAMAASLHRTAESTKSDDAKKIGIPAAGGAVVGAILGGKKGAGIGTAIGGGAGAAVVLTTPGAEVNLPRGTSIALALESAVDIRVPIARTPRPE